MYVYNEKIKEIPVGILSKGSYLLMPFDLWINYS